MVLVDTSVWSLALRRRKGTILGAEEQELTATLAKSIRDGQVVLIGPIRQELLSGIKEKVQFERLRLDLEAYRDEALTTADYEEAARLYNVCRAHGQQCGPIDILVCAVATRRDWRVLTADREIKTSLQIISSAIPRSKADPEAKA